MFQLYAAQAAVREAWVQRYTNNGSVHAQAVAVDGNGNVVVTGFSDRSPYNPDYYTAKYAAADGAVLWTQRYNGPANSYDTVSGLALDGSGNVVVTGFSHNGTNSDSCYTAKYAAADGALLWEKRSNGGGEAVAVDASGNVIVTGPSYNSEYNYRAKYAAADGALVWEKQSNAGGQAVVMDASGNVIVTGSYAYNKGTNSDYYTAKYAATDGTLLWERRYQDPLNDSSRASAGAVDSGGNVVVTGYSFKQGNFPPWDIAYYTAKYAGVDGALLWEQHHNGLLDELGYSVGAVAVDGSGNVLVTGSCIGDRGSADYYTAKYASADGALLWETRYNSPANRADLARALAVDESGNVVVTGYSDNGTNSGYGTVKYAAADGELLWEKHYTDPAGASYFANGLALGPNGMVVVTGSPDGAFGPGTAWATVVYRENLPPVSVALDPAGIRLRFSGVPGQSYNVERALAVTGPWITIATPTASSFGLIEYHDTPPLPGQAFYRIVQP